MVTSCITGLDRLYDAGIEKTALIETCENLMNQLPRMVSLRAKLEYCATMEGLSPGEREACAGVLKTDVSMAATAPRDLKTNPDRMSAIIVEDRSVVAAPIAEPPDLTQ